MQKLWIRSAPEGWAEGLKLLKDDLSFTLDPAGLPLTVSVSDGLTVRFDGKEAILTCREKVHFFPGDGAASPCAFQRGKNIHAGGNARV